jgi:hypothetical protein
MSEKDLEKLQKDFEKSKLVLNVQDRKIHKLQQKVEALTKLQASMAAQMAELRTSVSRLGRF